MGNETIIKRIRLWYWCDQTKSYGNKVVIFVKKLRGKEENKNILIKL